LTVRWFRLKSTADRKSDPGFLPRRKNETLDDFPLLMPALALLLQSGCVVAAPVPAPPPPVVLASLKLSQTIRTI
jgi:hypothetical protein